MKICDLHTHSNYSDGTLTPTELLNLAIDSGISAVALCDHNTVDGVPQFLEAAKGKAIEAVAGCEITTEYNGIELHVLGLFIPKDKFKAVNDFCEALNLRKKQANKKLVEDLNKAGYEIDYEKLVTQNVKGQINRAHVARVLVEKGYCESIPQAFKTLLKDGGQFYKSPKREDTIETIRFLKDIGAVPVIAHPFYSTTSENLSDFWEEAVKSGLVGMESHYPMYDEKTAALAALTAEKYGILHSGGSDFHGTNKPHISIGSGKGNLRVPYEFFEKLKCAQKTCK